MCNQYIAASIIAAYESDSRFACLRIYKSWLELGVTQGLLVRVCVTSYMGG